MKGKERRQREGRKEKGIGKQEEGKEGNIVQL